MKKLFLIIVFILAGLTAAYAVPAYPGPIKVTQPDGTTLIIYMHGDEFLNWATCGNSLVSKGSDGYWHYASFDADGTLKAQGTIVRSSSSGDGSSVTPPASSVLKAQKMRNEMAKGAQSIRKAASVSGSDRHLVMLIQFADTLFTVSNPQTAFSNMLNQEDYSDNGATGSVRDYYSDNSHGMFTPGYDVIGPITVSGTMSSYSEDDGLTQNGAPRLLAEACAIADPYVDFSKYDLDGDGYIDQIFFYYAGHNAAEGASGTIWPHAWAVYYDTFTFDGVRLYSYACSSELKGESGTNMAGIGTFCHEFGHVIGLPDFYDVDYSSNGYALALQKLSLMSSGNYNNNGRTPPYLTYEERHILGWDEGLTLLTDGANTLSRISDNKAYYVPTSNEGEYYLFESRPAEGWDAYTYSPGMAIYHIDKSDYLMPTGYTAAQHWEYGYMINAYSKHQCMDLVETVTPESSVTYTAQLTFPGRDGVTEFTSESSPSATAWSGAAIGYNLTDISFDYTSGVTSFTVTKDIGVTGIVTTVSGEPLPGVEIVLKQMDMQASSAASSYPNYQLTTVINPAASLTNQEYIAVSDNNGEFSFDLKDAGSYSISASKEGYLPYADVVTVDAISNVDIVMQTVADAVSTDLHKYNNLTINGYACGVGENSSLEVAMAFTPEELEPYVGMDISSISFVAYNGELGDADMLGVRVYFNNELKCDVNVAQQIYGTLCTVDISECGLKIPSDSTVHFSYYFVNSPYSWPMGLTDEDASVTNGNLWRYLSMSETNPTTWYETSLGNYIISARVVANNQVFDIAGFNYIPTAPSYNSGDTFDLTLQQSSVNPPSSVTWTFDGESASGSVTLTAGVHIIRANVTYPSGRTEVIETKINVTE